MAEAAREDISKQASLCLTRRCPVLELFIDGALTELSAAEVGGFCANEEDGAFSSELVDAYRLLVNDLQDLPANATTQECERYANRAARGIRMLFAQQFVAANFCHEAGGSAPEQLYNAGHAGECVWLDRQILKLRERNS